jgi:hypothetical protein
MFECQNYNALRSFKRHAAFFYLNSFWSNPFLGLRRKAIFYLAIKEKKVKANT